MTRVSPYSLVIFIFFDFEVLVGLVNNSSDASLTVLTFPHFRLTRLKMSWVARQTSLRKTWGDQFLALKMSWMLKKASLRKNSLIILEPQ